MAKIKKVQQLAQELRNLGHQVSLYKRKDGGYLIRKINGTTFSGSKGNITARKILGVRGSSTQLKVNRFIAKTYNKSVSQRIMKMDIDKLHGKNLFKRVHREWKAEVKKGLLGGGKVTWEKYQYNIEHKSVAEAERLLKENFRYAKGLAYTENVSAFRQWTEDMKGLNATQQAKQQRILELLDKKGNKLTERELQRIIEMRYDAENGEETGVDMDDYLNYVIDTLEAL